MAGDCHGIISVKSALIVHRLRVVSSRTAVMEPDITNVSPFSQAVDSLIVKEAPLVRIPRAVLASAAVRNSSSRVPERLEAGLIVTSGSVRPMIVWTTFLDCCSVSHAVISCGLKNRVPEVILAIRRHTSRSYLRL